MHFANNITHLRINNNLSILITFQFNEITKFDGEFNKKPDLTIEDIKKSDLTIKYKTAVISLLPFDIIKKL